MGERVHPGEAVFGQDRQDQEIHESDTPSTCSNNEVLPGPDFQVPQHQIYDQLAYIESRDHHLQNVPFDTVTGYSHQPPVVSLNDRPGLVFNGYILEPSAKPIPEEFIRIQSGTSIAEPGSILDEESGRTYYNHNTGKYYLPNDAAEQDRLDLQHKVWLLYHWGELYKAPVVSPRRVLDIATGTGIWACQLARQHPDAQVTGTDLSLIQPLNAPENCTFIKEDSEHDEWIFPNSFDLIFMRMVVSCFDSHLTIFQKSFDNLEPGGWLEIHDATFELLCTDGSCTGSSIERWCSLMLQAAGNIGRDFTAPRKYKHWLIETGFVDVVEDIGPMPGNPWPSDPRNQDLGRWNLTNLYRGIRGMSWKLLRGLGMTPAEVEDLIEQVKFDITNIDMHFCFPFFTVYGRKPYPEEAIL